MQGRVFLGRYETIRLLGEGGMGRVYLCNQADLGREVVVKVMHDHIAADPKFRERFARETLLMARFQHPYAVALYDASINDPNGPCIVMEYLRGIGLDAVLQKHGKLQPGRAGRLLGQFCEVLQAAHDAGIIHRDLKPANIMIVESDTNHEFVKVMDFGLAKLVAPGEMKVTETNTEFAVGTPGYMCPEQARGEEMDHRGDLYSVGVLLYEMLTGRLPFAGKSTMEMLLAHATEEPPTFAAVGAARLVPYAVEQLVYDCLAKDPAQRPNSARELAERYETAMADSVTAATVAAVRASLPPNLSVPTVPRLPAPAGPPAPASTEKPPPRPMPSGRVAIQPPSSGGYTVTPEASTPLPVGDSLDVVHYMDAWMPERIATYKVCGFIDDAGGEVIENVPGRLRVRMGGKGCVYAAPRRLNSLSWLGISRKMNTFEMELRFQRDSKTDAQLRITLVLRSPSVDIATDESWRNLCAQIYCDLRAYLMAQGGAVAK
jgi:eukaryotic-like serine/threonine-protein kinase